jgi:hypothetical protein
MSIDLRSLESGIGFVLHLLAAHDIKKDILSTEAEDALRDCEKTLGKFLDEARFADGVYEEHTPPRPDRPTLRVIKGGAT